MTPSARYSALHAKPIGGPVMTDLLDTKLGELKARMDELAPLVTEYRRLEAATAALGDIAGPVVASNGGSTPKSKAAKPKAAVPRERKPTGRPRGRPKGSGTRGAEALALVKAQPGITIPEVAEKMGIKQNYLYRVLPGLAEDGLVKKVGAGWEPVSVLDS